MEFNFDRGMSVWYFRNSFVQGDSTQKVFFVNVKGIFTMKFLLSSCCVLNAPTSRLCSTAVKIAWLSSEAYLLKIDEKLSSGVPFLADA